MNDRKRQIIRAARTLFVEKGFMNTSILDIIDAAKISKGTFYNHFNSKSECLIAILEESREETMNRRYEMGLNGNPSNVDLLIEQICVVIHVNRKTNLLRIFESVSGVPDHDIREVLNQQLLKETTWIAKRLTDVFGKEIEPISYECATLVLGMIQHTMRTIVIITREYPSPELIVKMAIRNIQAIIPLMKTSDELIITNEIFNQMKTQLAYRTVSKELLIKQLSGFVDKLNDTDPESGIEMANHLLHVLKEPNVKLFVLESILISFIKAFSGTLHEPEAREIGNSFWFYLRSEQTKKQTN
ncbi:TetR/AcrR family transcriptional regulator [Ureibacillus sp. NPDC094379]